MKRGLIVVACLACLSSAAWSQADAPGPDAANYPDPQCQKPRVNLVKPGVWNDKSGAVDGYNLKVKAFNKEASVYNSCMHAFIDKANNDVKRIQDKANADLKQISDRANASMKIVQDKIHQAVADANSVATAMDEETAKLRKQ
jgi:hypothetical protein